MSAPHRLLLASAGTGKTFRLTGRYLGLLLDGVAPERVLAVTFTRKAAGEILDRCVERLAEAAEGGAALRELAAETAAGSADARGCRDALVRLLRGLERVRVSTLDAFYARLARAFALELGLAPDWGIVDEVDDAELRTRALGHALERADRAEWVGLIGALLKRPHAAMVHRELLRIAEESRETHLDAGEGAWEAYASPPAPGDEQLARARAVLEATAIPSTTKGAPDSRWAKELDRLRGLVANGVDGSAASKGLGKALLDGKSRYYGHEIEDELEVALRTLLDVVAHQHGVRLAARNRATAELAARFEGTYARERAAAGALRFGDVARALERGDDARLLEEWRAELAFRLDGQVDHLLLDEFQDTAPVQWRILEPLAEELLATGDGSRSLFVVGDVKQSIYGWREAEPRLLSGLARRHPALDADTLVGNWRSSPVVLDTVERVMRGVEARADALLGDADQAAAARALVAEYPTPEARRAGRPGDARLLQARPAMEGEAAALPALRLAAERVAALRDEYPEASVGVLVRRNAPIALLQHLLLSEHGVRSSGEGGSPLTDAEAVQVVLSALHLADHPSDRLAEFHVRTSPLAGALGLGGAAASEDAARALRARLVRDGYGATCAALSGAVAEHFGAWDRRRFARLVDFAHAYDADAGLRPSRFVARVRDLAVEEPGAAGVRVMTVHRSKGLEFDAVVLPDLASDAIARTPRFATERPDPVGPIAIASHWPVVEQERLGDPGATALRRAHVRRTVTEELCVLYVALTRARHRIEAVVRDPDDARAKWSFETLLRGTLAPDAASEAGELWRHPDGVEGWYEPDAESTTDAPAPAPDRIDLAASSTRRALPVRRPSAAAARAVSVERLLAPPARALDHGHLVHRLFEEVEWVEGFDASDDELLSLLRDEGADDAAARRALSTFREALLAQPVRALLARREGEVWRERPYDFVQDGERCTGVFDRVVLCADAAEVIDFKTDREVDVEHHAPQLHEYRRVLARMTGLDEGAIRLRLAFVTVGVVEDVE